MLRDDRVAKQKSLKEVAHALLVRGRDDCLDENQKSHFFQATYVGFCVTNPFWDSSGISKAAHAVAPTGSLAQLACH